MPAMKKNKAGGSCVEDSIVKKIEKIKSKKKNASPDVNNSLATKKETKKHKPKASNDADSKIDSDEASADSHAAALMLKDVIDLGGTQEDFDMLQNVSDNEEELEICNGESSFNVAELITFMKSNGLKTFKKVKEKPEVPSEKIKEVEKLSPKACPLVPSNPPPHDQLLFKANEPWYTNVPDNRAVTPHSGVIKWKQYAEKLWENEISLSSQLRDRYQSSDQQWMKTVFTSGTINDKVSAHCLLLQESPVHHIKSLDALLAMAKKKSKRMAIQSIETLKEMFLSTVLPDNRKLFTFEQHDFSVLIGEKINVSALGWLVEDKLKACYSEYLDVIKTHLNDNEVPIRTKLCNLVFQLLNEKPEQEQELLAILVNKIGDPDNKLASKIIYILTQLLQNHPSMKRVVASEVERILFRPNISERAQYYSICFLNQLQLSSEDSAFAGHLIELYFKFFRESINNTNVDSRMLGGLLTGVNRAYPYTASQDSITEENIDTLFKLVYSENFNVSVQALMLLYQVSGSKTDICNRYCQALYSKLVDPSISTSSKKSFLLNLIYKSIKRDSAVVRKVAIARRLLQVSNLDEPFLACASLYTISEANKASNTEQTVEITKKDTGISKENESESKFDVKTPKSDSYCVSNRNPLYSNADRQDLWEFSLLSRNFHPSVNEFVASLLGNGQVTYSGDPFNDFTRTKFLDKFVFKNPKKDVKAANRKFYTRNQTDANGPQVYSSEFRDQKETKVNADERFFFDYFKAQKTTQVAESVEKNDSTEKPDALDFADDIKFASTIKDGKKKKSKDVEDEDEEASDSGSEFSYGDMDDDEDGGTEQLNDKAYEKFLWENLNSDGESIQGSDDDYEHVASNVMEEADEDDWEDLDVAASDDETETVVTSGGADSEFVDADDLDDIILQHSNKKKRKAGESSDGQAEPSKKNKKRKSKKSVKSKKNKFKNSD